MNSETTPSYLPDISDIYDLLYRLGASANYTGFFYTAHAVYLSIQDPARLNHVTKWLYPDIARHYNTTWGAVERNIRTIIKMVWDTSPEFLEKVAGFPLNERPKAARFLAILYSYFSRKKAA